MRVNDKPIVVRSFRIIELLAQLLKMTATQIKRNIDKRLAGEGFQRVRRNLKQLFPAGVDLANAFPGEKPIGRFIVFKLECGFVGESRHGSDYAISRNAFNGKAVPRIATNLHESTRILCFIREDSCDSWRFVFSLLLKSRVSCAPPCAATPDPPSWKYPPGRRTSETPGSARGSARVHLFEGAVPAR